MNRIRLSRASGTAMLIALALFGGCNAPTKAAGDAALNNLAVEAYVYAYPLVMMEMSRRIATNVETPSGTRAPINQFAFVRSYPDATFTDVVAPNADTLYEIAWFDVSKEPIVIHLPALGKRYALFPMLSAWTNVFESPGTRTTGEAEQTFAVTGPGWSGTLPQGVREVKSPTSMFWMIGRIYSDGTPADFAEVHKLQNAMTAIPLSSYGTAYAPPKGVVDPNVDMKTPVVQQTNALAGPQFFKIFADLLAANPPAADDAPMVAKLKQLGITPGQPLDTSTLDKSTVAAMAAAPAAALPTIKAFLPKVGQVQNGWVVSTTLGTYGTEYMKRACIALIGLGANLGKDAIYPATVKPLDGAKKYVMHFDKGMLPPAAAFWSITLYNKDQFFYGNPLNRYTLSQRNKFNYNADGSVDMYVQHDSPGGTKEANWLPAPSDKFSLIMRIYLPRETPPSILDGTWKVPPVQSR